MVDGKIITYYSFKGGVGRTFSLANCAFHWALAGRRVLVIDWDLTSPGLHHYFRPFLDRESPEDGGVIDYFSAIETGMELLSPVIRRMSASKDSGETAQAHRMFDDVFSPDRFMTKANLLPERWTQEIEGTSETERRLSGACLHIMTAGRQDDLYPARVARFDWSRFAERGNGRTILEHFRDWATRNYDFVLIDSRTGFDDIPALCTRLLPDMVAMWFAPNRQNIEGTVEMAELLATIGEGSFGSQGRPALFPVPTRIDDGEDCRDALTYAARRLSTVLRRPEGNLRTHLRDLAVPVVVGMQSTERLAWPSRVGTAGGLVDRYADIIEAMEDALGVRSSSPPASAIAASPSYRAWYDGQVRLSDPRVHEVEQIVEEGDPNEILLFLEQMTIESTSTDAHPSHLPVRKASGDVQTIVRVLAKALEGLAALGAVEEVPISNVVSEVLSRVSELTAEIHNTDRCLEVDFALATTDDLIASGVTLLGRTELLEKLAFFCFEEAVAIAGTVTSRDGTQSTTRRRLRAQRTILRGMISKKLSQPSRSRPLLKAHAELLGSLPTEAALQIEFGELEMQLMAVRANNGDLSAVAIRSLELYRQAGIKQMRMEEAVEFVTALMDAAIQSIGGRQVTWARDLRRAFDVADWLASVDVESNRYSRQMQRLGMSFRLQAAVRLVRDDPHSALHLFEEAVGRIQSRDIVEGSSGTAIPTNEFLLVIVAMLRVDQAATSRALDRLADAVLRSPSLLRSFAYAGRILPENIVRPLEILASDTGAKAAELVARLIDGRRSPLRRPGRPIRRRPERQE